MEVAQHVLRKLELAIMELAERPRLGHRRGDLTAEDLRFWPVFSYLIVYDPTTFPLTVVRVLHGSRDIAQELERK